MWRWLRLSFLIGMAALPLVLGWGLKAAHVATGNYGLPGGVSLTAVLVAACIAWEVVALDAALELPYHPLPPESRPRHEVGYWLLYSLLGSLSAATFALLAWLALGIPRALLSRSGCSLAAPLVYAVTFLGLSVGTLYSLAWLGNQPWSGDLRRFVRYRLLRLHTSDEEIVRLLERAPLPEAIKVSYKRRIGEHGVTLELAGELLTTLRDYRDRGDLRGNISYAMLVQSLTNLMEERGSSQR